MQISTVIIIINKNKKKITEFKMCLRLFLAVCIVLKTSFKHKSQRDGDKAFVHCGRCNNMTEKTSAVPQRHVVFFLQPITTGNLFLQKLFRMQMWRIERFLQIAKCFPTAQHLCFGAWNSFLSPLSMRIKNAKSC